MRFRHLLLYLFCVTILACDSSQPVVAPVTSGAPAPPPAPLPASPSVNPQANSTAASPSAPQANPGQPGGQPGAGAPSSGSAASPPPAIDSDPIQLSHGVALAQTGPDGTTLLFSVDYEFKWSAPNSSMAYRLVIRSNTKKSESRDVTLSAKGTLEMRAEELKLEDGPFTAVLWARGSERMVRTISNEITLESP